MKNENINKFKNYILVNTENTIEYVKIYKNDNIELLNNIISLKKDITNFEIGEEVYSIVSLESYAEQLGLLIDNAEENQKMKIKIRI